MDSGNLLNSSHQILEIFFTPGSFSRKAFGRSGNFYLTQLFFTKIIITRSY
jgi:hypothetical protein